MAKSPYSSSFEADVDAAQKKAERFFTRLLAEAQALPKAKLLTKAPAALAAAYAIFALLDGADAQDAAAMMGMLGTVRTMFEAEVEQATKRNHKT